MKKRIKLLLKEAKARSSEVGAVTDDTSSIRKANKEQREHERIVRSLTRGVRRCS